MLTDTQIRQAKARSKPYKLFDEKGLFALVNSGSKLWRFRYKYQGKEKLLTLGDYPAVSLKEARQARDAAKSLLKDGIDPSAERQERKKASAVAQPADDTFQALAKDYVALKSKTWSPRTVRKYLNRLELYVYPAIGNRPIKSITASELQNLLQELQDRKKLDETAHIVRMLCSQIFRYGIACGRCEIDPALHLKSVIAERGKATHAAVIGLHQVPDLLRKIDGYEINEQTRLALQIMTLTFTRTLELLCAKWDEIDWENELWTIPAARMKGKTAHKRPHIVPLAPQALTLFKRLYQLNGHREYVFAGVYDPRKHAACNTLVVALERLGYGGVMTGHGFRSLASTWLKGCGRFNSELVERQLAHVVGNRVANAYDRGSYLEQRTEIMIVWANQIDAWRAGNSTDYVRAATQNRVLKPSELAAKLKQADTTAFQTGA